MKTMTIYVEHLTRTFTVRGKMEIVYQEGRDEVYVDKFIADLSKQMSVAQDEVKDIEP